MTETLLTNRCNHCGWAGSTDAKQCPNCGHGLTSYEVIKE